MGKDLDTMWKIIIANLMVVLAGYISCGKTFAEFKKPLRSLRTIAFIMLVLCALFSTFLGIWEITDRENKITDKENIITDQENKIKDTQEIVMMPTKFSLENILKQHRKNNYHQMCEKLPYIHKVLIEKLSTIPPEKEEPRFIAELMTTFFLPKGSNIGEPILFKDKTSPRPGLSLYEWVETYEDVKIDNFSDIEKINTRIGKFVYDFIYEKVFDYFERVKSDNIPNHKELMKTFIDIAVREIYLEKLPTDFDTEMLDVYDEERKKRIAEVL